VRACFHSSVATYNNTAVTYKLRPRGCHAPSACDVYDG
jgi:hypothetical protein